VARADLVLAPTALGIDWPVVLRCLLPARMFENNIFLAYANYAGQDQSTSYIGESVILSPSGKELARADDRECWIEAQLDRDEIPKVRARLNFLKDYQALI
jgi:predicted amidohydrolase